MVHETKESSLQKSPKDSCLALLVEHGTDDSAGCEFKPTGGEFLTKFILFCATLDLSDNLCVTLDLSDNLTEMCQIGLS